MKKRKSAGKKLNHGRRRRNPRAQIEAVEEDRISELPDCILVQILSLLPSTEDAIRTGTLSKRWKSLWSAVPNLIFTNHEYNDENFVDFVNKALIQRGNQCGLNKLVISFGYQNKFKGSVYSWILYALIFKVNILEMDLVNSSYWGDFLLPEYFYLNPYIKNLLLNQCLCNPFGPVCWKSLKILSIGHTNLNEGAIKNILSGSPVLEHLELYYCYGFERLEITSKSVKKLVFAGFYDRDYDDPDRMVEVYAPNIVSLDIEREFCTVKVRLRDISSLVEAKLDIRPFAVESVEEGEDEWDLDEEKLLEGLLGSLRHLNEVKIGVWCVKMLSHLESKGLPFSLPKIRHIPGRYSGA